MFVGVETTDHLLLAGDTLLLCSDGLHGAVPAADLAHIVTRSTDLKLCARELIDTANERDGGDNVSVQLIRIRNVERMGMYRGRPYKLA
jgi:protein phosphatase